MLSAVDESAGLVGNLHRAKLAYIYIRQSSAGQVRHHQESTHLQYRLVDRAADLGWPRERIEVVDDDLGKSGASSLQRYGFQRLLAEIGLGKAGLVLSLDASRLARNNRDWHQLLELCSIFGVLIGDGERLYDPGAYHDRLLLGLSGIMSEAELHQIRMRMHQGERQKAARGALRQALSAGLVHERDGRIGLNPDEEVQARLRFVFTSFRQLQSANAVMRALISHGLALPVRPLRGPAPHQVCWVPSSSGRVLDILHNPGYAGAYTYGKRRVDPVRRRTGSTRTATTKVALDQWPVCLRDAHPGYIGWEEFMANQKQLAGNAHQYVADAHGVPRQGRALLQGVVVCARCARRMSVRYSGPEGNYPVYVCTAEKHMRGGPRCQEVRAMGVDAEFEHILLEALTPDQIALAVASVGQFEAEQRVLKHQWDLKRERARYETERARRQYDAVEPEHRLVARSLERVWEERMREGEAVEQAYEAWRSEQPGPLADSDCAEVLAMASDLQGVWKAATPEERKRMLRLVVREVALDQKRAPGMVWMRVIWQTGATSEHWISRRVLGYADYADTQVLADKVRKLNAAGMPDRDIAARLNAEGLRSAHGVSFTSGNIYVCRTLWGIATSKINGVLPNPARWPDGSYSVQGAAEALRISTQTVFKWLRCGRLTGHQNYPGAPWKIVMNDEQIKTLANLVRRTSPSRKEAS